MTSKVPSRIDTRSAQESAYWGDRKKGEKDDTKERNLVMELSLKRIGENGMAWRVCVYKTLLSFRYLYRCGVCPGAFFNKQQAL
jgi:hypothetical protein